MNNLLQAVLEGYLDGVMILTEQGKSFYANQYARQIFQQFSSSSSDFTSLPNPIQKIFLSLLESRKLFPDKNMIIENEFTLDQTACFRIRGRWFELNKGEPLYIFITVEDLQKSSQNIADYNANKYGFTDREAEVWSLRLANYSYKEIAQQLYITTNTVKKHMKNIYAKQQSHLSA